MMHDPTMIMLSNREVSNKNTLKTPERDCSSFATMQRREEDTDDWGSWTGPSADRKSIKLGPHRVRQTNFCNTRAISTFY